jgi:hypothetical protein
MSVVKTNQIEADFDDGTLGDEPVVWGLEKMVGWRLAWQRAVAKAWALDAYKVRLLDSKTTHLALKEVGWEVPEGLEIEIKAAKGIEWDENISQCTIINRKTGEEVAANGWAYEVDLKHKKVVYRKTALLNALKTKVIMTLPPEPSKKDAEFAPLALADYDGLSRAYPFTCSCVC